VSEEQFEDEGGGEPEEEAWDTERAREWYADEPEEVAWDTERAREWYADEWPEEPPEQLVLFDLCHGTMLRGFKRLAVVYEREEGFVPRGFDWAAFPDLLSRLFLHDPIRMGHPAPPGTKMTKGGRCEICERLRQSRRLKLSQGQRAIRAAECWQFIGGPPSPRGGRPRKRIPGNKIAGQGWQPSWAQIGYPVSRGFMARRWGVSEVMIKWATALVSRDSKLARSLTSRVRRGKLGLKRAYEELLIREGASGT
jgi:hypothetical protein